MAECEINYANISQLHTYVCFIVATAMNKCNCNWHCHKLHFDNMGARVLWFTHLENNKMIKKIAFAFKRVVDWSLALDCVAK